MRKPRYDRVTVVIPVFNRATLLSETLASIQNASGADSAQVIVTDDGSTEPITSVVSKYREQLHIDYVFQEHAGFRAAKARNAALSCAKNPLLIFVDCGMLVSPQFLKAHIAAHNSAPAPSLVAGYNFGFDRDNENAAALEQLRQRVKDLFAELRSSTQFSDPREPVFRACRDDLNALPAPWTLTWTCNLSIETDVFRILAGFNENFVSWGGEDTEFAYRAYRCGIQFEMRRDAEALHLPHPKDGKTLQQQSVQNFMRETRMYCDPMLAQLEKLGDIELNLSCGLDGEAVSGEDPKVRA